MKVALLIPPFDQLASAGFRGRTRRVYGYSMPLGIAYLAAVLERAGHVVCVLDPCPSGMTITEIGDWLVREQPDIVGISAMTHNAPTAYAVARESKQRLPDTPVIMGGSHCTVFPDAPLRDSPDVDIAVIGEAEDRIVAIVEALYHNCTIGTIPGLVLRDPARDQWSTGPLLPQHHLDQLPFPARHLFDNSSYTPFPDQIRQLPVTNLMTTRGCSWRKCKFCFEGGKYMPHYRRRSPENVVQEFIDVHMHGFRGVAIWDDNFCISERWVATFCDLLRREKLDMSWTCYGRVDTVSADMLRALKSAGCFSIYFGFESGNQKILDMICKGTTLDEARRAVKLCHEIGLEVRGSFILGLPHDTPALAKQTIAFARELDLDSVKFMLYTPEDGTELYQIARNNGTFIPRGFLGSLSMATYLPRGYASVAQLEGIAMQANRSYVLRPAFLWRKLKSIRGWRDIAKYYDGFRLMMSLANNR